MKAYAVIGGGLGGTATNALAGNGNKVTLFEQSRHLGGCAQTQKEVGYSLNLGPHALYRGGAANLSRHRVEEVNWRLDGLGFGEIQNLCQPYGNTDLSIRDFDFLVGHWKVHLRNLKQRLVNNHEWIEFEGTLFSQPFMGSYSYVDDLALNVPGAPYRGVALRSFDPKTHQWSIWWVDSRAPLGPLDPPIKGSFQNGWVLSLVMTRSMASQFGRASSGPRSLGQRVTGSRRTRQMRAKPGRQTGRRTSSEVPALSPPKGK